jgi:hypothetical protein
MSKAWMPPVNFGGAVECTNGGLIGVVFRSKFTICNSYSFETPLIMNYNSQETSKKRGIGNLQVFDIYTFGDIGTVSEAHVNEMNIFSNLPLNNQTGSVLLSPGAVPLDTSTVRPGKDVEERAGSDYINRFGVNNCTSDEETLILAIETYFDCNLWVGDILYFIPQLNRLDCGTNKGVINFDDVTANGANPTVLAAGYQGFNFANLYAVNPANGLPSPLTSAQCSIGLNNSLTSFNNVAVNLNGGVVTVTSAQAKNGLFCFISGYFTAVCDSPQILTFTGSRKGVAVYNGTIEIQKSYTIPFAPYWQDIDTLTISSALPGTLVIPGGSTVFAIDDLLVQVDNQAIAIMAELGKRIEDQDEQMRNTIEQMRKENEQMRQENQEFKRALDELKKRLA